MICLCDMCVCDMTHSHVTYILGGGRLLHVTCVCVTGVCGLYVCGMVCLREVTSSLWHDSFV